MIAIILPRDKWADKAFPGDKNHQISPQQQISHLMYKADDFLPARAHIHAHFKLAHAQPATFHLVMARLSIGLHLPLPTLKQQPERVHGLFCLKSSLNFCITLEYTPCFLSKPSKLSETTFCFCVTVLVLLPIVLFH